MDKRDKILLAALLRVAECSDNDLLDCFGESINIDATIKQIAVENVAKYIKAESSEIAVDNFCDIKRDSIKLKDSQQEHLDRIVESIKSARDSGVSLVFDRDASRFFAFDESNVEHVNPGYLFFNGTAKNIHNRVGELKPVLLPIDDFCIRDCGFAVEFKK